MVTVEVPAAAVLLAVSVSTLEVVEDVGLNDAVTPVGNPDAANDTLPVNGLTSVTVMVSVPLEPATTDSAVADGFSVKVPVPPGTTFSVMGSRCGIAPGGSGDGHRECAGGGRAAGRQREHGGGCGGCRAERSSHSAGQTGSGKRYSARESAQVRHRNGVGTLAPWVTERLVGDAASVKPVPEW
jgi:hypothetical protein